MSENARLYSVVCSKIGLAMLLFYAFFTLSTFGVAIFSSVLGRFINPFTADIIYEILLAIVYFLSFSAGAFILRKITKDMPTARPIYTSFNLSKYFVLLIIAIIAVNYTLAFLNSILVTSIVPSFGTGVATQGADLEGKSITQTVILFIISIVSTAVVPAICEEYLFRGAVLPNLLPFGQTTAIIGSAFLFGLMHQNPMQMLYTTLMGIVLGYVYVKTKSIWACMIIHFVNNLITVFEEYLPHFTNSEWVVALMNLIIIIAGSISLALILFKRDKEPSIDENGSFGVVYDRGMDVDEYELTRKERVKSFFAPTMIIYTAISVFLMLKILVSYFI